MDIIELHTLGGSPLGHTWDGTGGHARELERRISVERGMAHAACVHIQADGSVVFVATPEVHVELSPDLAEGLEGRQGRHEGCATTTEGVAAFASELVRALQRLRNKHPNIRCVTRVCSNFAVCVSNEHVKSEHVHLYGDPASSKVSLRRAPSSSCVTLGEDDEALEALRIWLEGWLSLPATEQGVYLSTVTWRGHNPVGDWCHGLHITSG